MEVLFSSMSILGLIIFCAIVFIFGKIRDNESNNQEKHELKVAKEAENGNANAQYQLAVHQDYRNANSWDLLHKAAEQGHCEALYVLCFEYSSGGYAGINKEKAKQLFQKVSKLAEQGIIDAQYVLYRLYNSGYGVAKDAAKAIEWFQKISKSAAQGNIDAQCYIVKMSIYRSIFGSAYGVAIPKDYPNAEQWLLKAAEQGHAEAQYTLGCLYNAGIGVPSDESKAKKWYKKAAAQGHFAAQKKLYSRTQKFAHNTMFMFDPPDFPDIDGKGPLS